jgi:hypothetical protein
MAGTFPTLSTGSVCMRPVTRTISAAVRVLRKLNDTEQRFRTAPILSGWELTYTRMKWADVETLRTFFETQKGAFDTTWSFPFDGATYNHLAFDQDEFMFSEQRLGRFDVSLRIRQVKKSGTYVTSGTATYPTINGGVITQLPANTSLRYLTTRNDMASGLRFTRTERDNPLRAWMCSYPVITSTEAATLVDFFTSMGGRRDSFTFEDPNTGTDYTARFAQDEFRWQFVGHGISNVSLQIEQVPG